MRCTSVVGVSNFGKSALLRAMTDPQIQSRYLGSEATGYLFIYVDFNQMLEMSEQAFSELVLRCCLEALRSSQAPEEILRRVETAYTGLVAPASSFEIPLRFAQAMAAIGDLLPQQVVFLMDELDEPVQGIDGRVFLNLRALKDRHWQCLSYITATNRRLGPAPARCRGGRVQRALRSSRALCLAADRCGDCRFRHPFRGRRRRDVQRRGPGFPCDPGLAAIRACWKQHAGCLACDRATGARCLAGLDHSSPGGEILVQDLNIQAECRKIWGDLAPGEQEALLSLHHSDSSPDGPSPQEPEMESVIAKHLVVGRGAEQRVFARAFDEFHPEAGRVAPARARQHPARSR